MNTLDTLEMIQDTISANHLIEADDIVCVMLSGGGDSVALLRALADLRETLNFTLAAYHLNHQLRPGSAEADQAFAQALCQQLKVELRVDSFDVKTFAQVEKLNLEDAGRRIRYEHAQTFLNELLEREDKRRSQGKLATGHTRDDRIETFFSRALFGAGAGGLGSIKAQRDNIIRPLITCDRAQLRAYLTELGQDWREDESNDDTTRTRAYIRAQIIPACEQLNPSFRDALERSMNLVADDDALLSNMANSFARDFSDDRVFNKHIVFNNSFMRTLETTMIRRTIRAGILQMFPQSSRIEAAHIQALAENMDCEGYVQDLPDGLHAEVRCGTLKITKKGTPETWSDVVLNTEGKTDLGPAGLLFLEEVNPDGLIYDSHIANVDADVFLGSLSAGPARTGERITPLGMPEGSQLISDVFIDAKVPKEQRGLVPVVRDASEVVWIAGQKLADRYKVTEKTQRVWQFEWVEDSDRNIIDDGRGPQKHD